MTEQQEDRPFLALVDDELEAVVTALTGEAVRHLECSDSGQKFYRLAELGWQELKRRRAIRPSTGAMRCNHFATSLVDHGVHAIHCEGIEGHDGPHFIGSHLTRREWR